MHLASLGADLGWGPQWDTNFYQDPAKMVTDLHDMNMQLMVSVWSKFDNNTKFYEAMTKPENDKFMIADSIYYDAWNPDAREVSEHSLVVRPLCNTLLTHSPPPPIALLLVQQGVHVRHWSGRSLA